MYIVSFNIYTSNSFILLGYSLLVNFLIYGVSWWFSSKKWINLLLDFLIPNQFFLISRLQIKSRQSKFGEKQQFQITTSNDKRGHLRIYRDNPLAQIFSPEKYTSKVDLNGTWESWMFNAITTKILLALSSFRWIVCKNT
jgi:hypothetical protein